MAEEPSQAIVYPDRDDVSVSTKQARNTKRKYSTDIKSLLHFNYPYYGEPGDGLEDEVSLETWTRIANGNGLLRLVGSENPCDALVEGTPKFGYRCLETDGNSTFISGTNTTGIWNFTDNGNREIDFWIRPTASAAGNIFALYNSGVPVLTLSKSDRNTLSLSNTTTTQTSSTALTLSVWSFVRVTFKESATEIRINGTLTDTLNFTVNASATSVRIGGITGQIDEFCYKHSSEGSGIIGTEYAANLDFNDMGGYGTGNDGSVSVNSNSMINAYARVKSANGRSLTTGSWTSGLLGAPKAGDEIMLHVTAKTGSAETYLGCYAFRKAVSVNGTTLTLDKEVLEEFPLQMITEEYVIQAVKVPNFKDFTVNAGKTVTPLQYSAETGGGIIAFRCRGDARINGSVLCSGYGPTRTDMLQMTHGKIIDNFVLNRGGGIMMIVGGTLTAPSSARIGASWDGSGKEGVPVQRGVGNPGGAGYGASGGGDTDNGGTGGYGGVGGGGGGGDGHVAGSAGSSGTGGFGVNLNWALGKGGTQGITAGGNSPHSYGDIESGGGGAGGNAGNEYGGSGNIEGGISGSNAIIICKVLNVDASAVSTGGGTIPYTGLNTAGGGGTGFCYIACEEMI